jgi:hypothetical protein
MEMLKLAKASSCLWDKCSSTTIKNESRRKWNYCDMVYAICPINSLLGLLGVIHFFIDGTMENHIFCWHTPTQDIRVALHVMADETHQTTSEQT